MWSLDVLSLCWTKEGIELDCSTIPPCRMSCKGPSEELIWAVSTHTACMVEWLVHAGWLKGVTCLVMFLFMNVSRAVIVAGIVKCNWK